MRVVTDFSKSFSEPMVLIIGLQSSFVDRADRRTRLVADTLRGQGYDVQPVNMLSVDRDGRGPRLLAPAYKVVSGLCKWRNVLSAIRRHDLIQVDFDLVNSSRVSALILLVASGFLGKRSVLAVSCVSGEAVLGLRGLIFRRMLRTANVVIAGSEESALLLRRFNANVKVIPLTALAHGTAMRHDNGLQPRVGLVAPIGPGILGSVVRGLGLVKQKYPRAELVIMANREQAGAIKSQLAESAQNGVDLVVCENELQMVQALYTCDVYFETSSQVDPSPTLIEALAQGVPVVGIDTAGTINLMSHGVTGLVVAAGNHVDLANRLCELVETPELVRTLSSGAGALAKQHDRAAVSAAWAQLYFMFSAAGQKAPDWPGRFSPGYQTTVKA